jgi:hypothetical protein
MPSVDKARTSSPRISWCVRSSYTATRYSSCAPSTAPRAKTFGSWPLVRYPHAGTLITIKDAITFRQRYQHFFRGFVRGLTNSMLSVP